jgi:hypothetical protein
VDDGKVGRGPTVKPVTTKSYYEDLINSFEVTVLYEEEDNDYQGDTRVLLTDGTRWGVLTFGWGFCSGCDSLQACNTDAEVTELRDELWQLIVWRDGPGELAAYIRDKDWTLDYSYSKTFNDAALSILDSR